MIDVKLLEILVCPRCKSRVDFDEKNNKIICNCCNLIYPVRDNIPIMLIDEAERF